jgi:hypothetical protein
MHPYSREYLHRIYLRNEKDKKVQKIIDLVEGSKTQILNSNLEGHTRCTIDIEPGITDEIFHNLLYRLRQLFKDVEFSAFEQHDNEKKYIEVDWTLPTYVVDETDKIED